MAQILKKSVKENIIMAAKKEFLEKGLKDASLRSIAKGANITVGNLYRYFTNKDEIIDTIVNPPLFELNELIKKLTNEKINLQIKVENVGLGVDDIGEILNALSFELSSLKHRYNNEIKILIKYSEKAELLKKWFFNLIEIMIREKDSEQYFNSDFIDVFSKTLCTSIFSGLSECLLSDNLSFEEEVQLMRVFFNSFLQMMKTDFTEKERQK